MWAIHTDDTARTIGVWMCPRWPAGSAAPSVKTLALPVELDQADEDDGDDGAAGALVPVGR